MASRIRLVVNGLVLMMASHVGSLTANADHVRDLQQAADEQRRARWARWGTDSTKYSSWTSHSNRLIPVYTFGIGLEKHTGGNSLYRRPQDIQRLYGQVSPGTLNSRAQYMDQTDIYALQKEAIAQGKRNIILMIFDGLDWQTTQAAAVHAAQKVPYRSGRGSGLYFQDYQGVETHFGFFVTSPHNSGTTVDADAQTVSNPGGTRPGGYVAQLGGLTPWARPRSESYLLGRLRSHPHAVTDSAASATSMTAGIKTYNGAINVDAHGRHVVPLARDLQSRGYSIGVVTSVTISHATPAAAYANNVTRNDYQDLTRDLLGLPSVAHRSNPLPGVDVLIGCGWGEETSKDAGQGSNFEPGNKYLTERDLQAISIENGGKYRVVQRTLGRSGRKILYDQARRAYNEQTRLFAYFGVTGKQGRTGGHLPYQTADGSFNPIDAAYGRDDVLENPTLADMVHVALVMLSQNKQGFWLMVEAGDVDWANHSNNIDNSIGAILSGDAAFRRMAQWLEKNNAWDETAVIVTSDHGHYFVLERPAVLIDRSRDVAERSARR